MTHIKKSIFITFSLLMAILLSDGTAFAETPREKGRKIMEQVDALPVLEKSLNQVHLQIFNAQGKVVFTKKSRGARYYSDFRDKDKRLVHTISSFFAPADDKGNGSLTIEVADDDDDQWIYLKGLRKPKRIIGSDKSSSFMGSDMSNGDLAPRNIDESDFTWLGTESISFKGKKIPVEKIEAAFKSKQQQKDYGVSRAILWIHVKSGLIFKSEQYDLNGQLFKTNRLLSFKVFKNKDNKRVFMLTGTEVKSVIRGTKTIMKMTNIKTGKAAASVRSDIFKTSFLTRRWW
ncbi:MAG: outer membrane lipoprotein-sorting protein [Proteobacteria bacterium]|nr:outer membrane lipoprotein-sorting protein [Pseudomonadota bacterium]